MVERGYAPAAHVAAALEKALSTVHRMVENNIVDGVRDGKSLYVSLASLESHYRLEHNKPMVDAVLALAKRLREEAGARVD
jgi:DNA-binding IclR family transcriptional regulator